MEYNGIPRVEIEERDLSAIVRPTRANIVGVVGFAARGPVDTVVTLSSPQEFIDTFGHPSEDNINGLGVLQVLKYTNSLKFVRQVTQEPDGNDNAEVATSDKTNGIAISAKNPGAWGNDIQVSIIKDSDVDTNLGLAAGDGFTVKIYEGALKDGKPNNNNLVEIHKVSINADDRNSNNESIYLPNFINENSKYINIDVDTDTIDVNGLGNGGSIFGKDVSSNDIEFVVLTDGDDGATPTYFDYKIFEDTDERVDILTYLGDFSATAASVVNTVDIRRDCIAPLQAVAMAISKPSAETKNIVESTSNYVVKYVGGDKVYHNAFGKTINLPKVVAGVVAMLQTEKNHNIWDAPAGKTRGAITFTSGAVAKFDKNEIDAQYRKNLNTSKYFPGEGHFIWGQKTAQLKASALDRINVRRLVTSIELNTRDFLYPFLFELNNDFNRASITAIIENYLQGIKSAGGLTDFAVICDTSNNTPQIIDNNGLLVDLFLKPARVIEYIKVRVSVTGSGFSFEELV